ncbi:MAG: hypothetical protein ABIA47_05095 [bacterium]
MDNLVQGIEALMKLMATELSVLISSPLIQGFIIGYVVATLIYGFVYSRNRHGNDKKKET